MNPTMQTQAAQLAQMGRGNDSMLMHVTPSEVQGLAGLARTFGRQMTANPQTGLPEAGWFEDLLPTLAAIGVTAAKGGAAAPAVAGAAGAGAAGTAAAGSALASGAATGAGIASALSAVPTPVLAGLASGGVKYAQTGDIGAALGTGLTAGGMSGITSGIMGAGAAPAAPEMIGSEVATQAAAPVSSAAFTPTQAIPTAPVPGGFDFSQAAVNQLGVPGGALTDAAAREISPVNLIDNPQLAVGQGINQLPVGATAPVRNAQINSVAPPNAPASAPEAPGLMDRLGGAGSQFMRGLKNIGSDKNAYDQFMSSPSTKLGGLAAITGMGLSGNAETRADMEEDEEEREKEGRKARNRILSNYASVGREAPWMFAEGGQVPFPMQSGGFVMTNDAVRGAGNGSQPQGLAALSQAYGAQPIRGKGSGTSDSIPAVVDRQVPARVSNGEAYVPPQGVKRGGGAKAMLETMRRLEKARGGKQ